MAEFTQNWIENKIFHMHELSCNRILSYVEERDGKGYDAVQLQPNGDYRVRITAPQASTVQVIPWFGIVQENGKMPWDGIPIEATKDKNGVFECVIPYDEMKTGPRHVDIYIDGTFVVWPYLPVIWQGNCVHNFLEVPDPDMEFIHVKNVPHGTVSRELYWSTETQDWERCMVYTPPKYMKSNLEYPVLYLLHGGGENETVWTSTGRANFIMDNLIAAGEAVPFIIVMANGMIRYPEDDKRGWFDLCFENNLINCVIPFIEENYRVRTDKWSRAIAGLSMGSYQSNAIGFHHPELFGYMGNFTSTMYSEGNCYAYENDYKRILANPEQFKKNYRVFFSSATPEEDHMDFFKKDHELMLEAGLGDMPGYHYIIHPARMTRWCSWRMGLRDYAKLLFRDK